MITTVKLNVSAAGDIIKAHGLDPQGRAQRLLTSEIFRMSAPYTPLKAFGTVAKLAEVSDAEIHYKAPYSRFLWYGKVMVGVNSRSAYARSGERKEVLKPEKDLLYSGGGKRGPRWVERMWADHSKEILRTVTKEAGGGAK